MYTPDEIKAMPLKQRQTAFDAQATLYYGTDRWKAQFARDIGFTKPAVGQWFTDDRGGPPAWAFQLVQAWREAKEAREHLSSLKGFIDYLQQI